MRNIEYFLGIYKQRGNVIPINWGILFHPEMYDQSKIQDIDRFTSSMFNNEAELKAYMVKNATDIGLKEVAVRDDLAIIVDSYIQRILSSELLRGNIGLRSTLLSLVNELSTSNANKRLLKAVYDEALPLMKITDVEKTLKNIIISQVKGLDSITYRQIENIITEVEDVNLSDEEVSKFISYLEGHQSQYEIEKTFPIEVMRKEKKPNSNKHSLNKMPYGVVYVEDLKFLDINFLKKILKNAVYSPNPSFLYSVFAKVNPTYQVVNVSDVRHYLEKVKAGNSVVTDLTHALDAIEAFVDYEVFVYNKYTNNVVREQNGMRKVNYLGLRKLALIVSNLSKQYYKFDENSLDNRVNEITKLNKNSFTLKKNIFDEHKNENN